MTFQHDCIFMEESLSFCPSVFISARGDVLSNVHRGLTHSGSGALNTTTLLCPVFFYFISQT